MYKTLDEAKAGIAIWKEHRRTVVTPISKSIAYKPTHQADYFREAAFYRFIELTESTFQLFESNLLVGVVVTARASMETLAVLWFINTKLEHLSTKKDLSHFNETMKRLILGWSNDHEFPEKINILTCIDSVDKELEGRFRQQYERLSEYAHPNFSGTFGAYAQPNIESQEVYMGIHPRSIKGLTTHVETTLIICISLLHSVQEKYEHVINSAQDVCHELFEAGQFQEHL